MTRWWWRSAHRRSTGANAAVCEAVAKAFGLRRSRVTLVSGATGRTKVLDVDAPDAEVSARLAALLNRPPDAGQI